MRSRLLPGAAQNSEAPLRAGRLGKLLVAMWILAVAARLILINQPYIDRWSWRQSDVAAIARNFSQSGLHFGYPQIDWAGDAPGYVGTEFPILPFVAAISYKLAGVQEWIGRSQAVIFFAVSLPFFFLLVREIFGTTAAVWATFFFAFAPLNIFAGRSFMPDVPSLSLSISGLYFFLRWSQDHRWRSLLLAATAISLSILTKVTSAVMFAPLTYLVVGHLWQTRGVSQKRPTIYHAVALFTAITLVPAAIWYCHAYQIAQQFYPHHFFGAGGIRIESLSWYWNIARQSTTSGLTPVLVIMALIGLFVVGRRPQHAYLFHWWLAGMILFIVVAGYGNRHPWYQLPLVPIAAALAGAGCVFVGSKISSRPAAIVLSLLLAGLFAILSFVNLRPRYESSAAQLRDAGLELIKITVPGALIVAADTGDPTIFYYAHRKGWHFLEEDGIYGGNPSDSQEAIVELEELRRRGATHFVVTTNTFWWLDYYPEFAQHLTQMATLLEATPEFKIYKLTGAAR